MFLDPGLQLNDTSTEQRYEYIQSADPEDMRAKFLAKIAAIAAENAARQSPLLPFNIYDIDISGGGDGHTFVVKILLATFVTQATDPAYWPAAALSNPQDYNAVFWLASTDEALRAASITAMAQFIKGGGAEDLVVGQAGAAKGTRFMAFIAGLGEFPPR